ncbi:FtsK/SpoIIIE domain-containing protein [Rosistilla oblonga]|uniref:FtsK/SpoIIIE domain-containing protein n=1 Tax=Rosistilla oblonga TaxID=2527990 RepID=UPI003A970CF1
MTTGLFTPKRQGLLLRGLADRCANGVEQWERLGTQHAERLAALLQQQQQEKQQLQAESEAVLRESLKRWDQADETVTSAYEQNVLEARSELNRMQVEFKRRHRQGIQEIGQRWDASKQQATQVFESKKGLPAQQKTRDTNRLTAAWNEIHQRLETGREIAMKRLHQLSDPPATSESYQPPASVDQAIETLDRLTADCDENLAQLGDDFSVRFLESVYPAIVMLLSLIVWSLGVLFMGAQPPALWLAAGLGVPIVVGILCFAIFTPRLKRITRQWYPGIEQSAVDAVAVVKDGQECATKAAQTLAQQIKDQHQQALRQADETKRQQTDALEAKLKQEREQRESTLRDRIAALENNYHDSFAGVENSHGSEFSDLSRAHKQRLADANTQRLAKREQLAAAQEAEDQSVAQRLRDGLRRGLGHIDTANAQMQQQHPDWESVVAGNPGTVSSLSLAPVGYLDVADYLRRSVEIAASKSEHDPASAAHNGSAAIAGKDYVRHGLSIADTLPEPMPNRLPVALTAAEHSGLLIDCPGGSSEAVIELVRAVLWRLLAALPPGELKLTLLDPIGRGQTFASLMALSDHDPTLVGHRAWTQPNQIEARLAELTQHMEDVLQTYLRDNYETIDQYNAQAGAMAEPYRVVAAIGIPNGLTPAGYANLRVLLENGRRCGIITVLVRDSEAAWPHDFAALPMDRLLHLQVDSQGHIRHTDPLLGELPFSPIQPPPNGMAAELVEKIGRGAIDGRRVEIPFDDVMPADLYNDGDASDGLDIPLGQQGAGRRLRMQLGEGVRQHMLVAGKTGSGKSTLLHTIITAGALKYSPDELHVYLLDFKKGVEFKLYADAKLPHARVIGIESEREFGQSVLERLDRELQRRGELFRASGVQEVGEYRRTSGQAMPRIMLVVDEFQELFIRDDRIAQDCTMLLDRLVRQGRSFGMHVILSSQSLAGAYSLPRNTLGQMAVRVALQCSESDALVILAEDNNAARLLSRPGEAIYNDAGGLVEGNQPFQVGWLDHNRHRDLLNGLAERYPEAETEYGPTVIFEGNRPARWSAAIAEAALAGDEKKPASVHDGFGGLLGEAVAIGPPVGLRLPAQPGRNVLMVCGDADLSRDVLGVSIASLYGGAMAQGKQLRVVMLDGRRSGDDTHSAAEFAIASGVPVEHIKPRDAEAKLLEIAELVAARNQMDAPEEESPVLVVIDPLERFRDLRQEENSFSFSLDAAPKQSGGSALQNILKDGSAAAVHMIVSCGSVETVGRWLSRQTQHDLEINILGRMSISDSSQLIDSPEAGRLSPASMLVYDDSSGRMEKFRVFDLPPAEAMQAWLESQTVGKN